MLVKHGKKREKYKKAPYSYLSIKKEKERKQGDSSIHPPNKAPTMNKAR